MHDYEIIKDKKIGIIYGEIDYNPIELSMDVK